MTVFHDTPDWSLGVIATEDDLTLTRDITLFRRSGDGYRKSTEQHVLRLYHPADVLQILESAGFHARRIRRYGDVPFRAGWAGFLAEKRG